MRYIITPFLAFILGLAQTPDTLWTKTYGSVLGDRGMSVQVTSDGGFIIAGCTFVVGGGGHNFYLIRTDSHGDTIWTNTYGGPDYDCARAVRQTADGGYVVVGRTYSFGGVRPDLYIVKTDSLGNMEWDRVYGGAEDDDGSDIQQTLDGGYVITGYTSSFGSGLEDLWLLRTDSSGDTAWTQTYGTNYIDVGSSVIQSTDSGFVITGTNGSGAAISLWILKTDANGVPIWSKVYYPGNYSSGSSLQQTTDGGYVIAGSTFAGAGESDFWLLKVDAQGDTVWTRSYGGAFTDDAMSVKQTQDGGFAIVGRTWSFGAGVEDFYVVRTDSFGDTLWTRTYGGIQYDNATALAITPDRGYVIVGSTESFGAGDYDVWLLRMETDPYGVEESEYEQCVSACIQVHPNPFCQNLQIRFTILDSGFSIRNPMLSIYDASGRLVVSFDLASRIENQESEVIWSGTDSVGRGLPVGVYFIELEVGSQSFVEKVVLVR